MIKLRSALAEELLMRQADYVNSVVLVADTHETVAVPDGARYAVVTAETLSYLKLGGTSFTLPGDIADGTAPVALCAGVPKLIDLQAVIEAGGTKLVGLRAAGTPRVTLEFFA